MTADTALQRLQSFDLSATVAALKDVVHNPTGNTTLSIVVLTLVVIAILMLVVFVLMLVTPSRKRVVKIRRYIGATPGESEGAPVDSGAVRGEALQREQGAQRKPPGQLYLALTGPIAVAVLVVLAFVGTYVVTSMDVYCAQTCHNASDMVTKAEGIGHAACVSCHETDGIFSIFANTSSRLRMLALYGIGRSPSGASVAVDSATCLGCHGAVKDKIITSKAGVRMSHDEVITGGQPCSVCHKDSGHTKKVFTSSMSTCLPCHDSKRASSTCATCHTADPGSIGFAAGEARKELGSGKIVYPAVRAANRRCNGCHNMARDCDSCHGVMMPHSNAFIEGGHARPAAFTGKVKCWKCHDPQWCSTGCHGAFSPDGLRSGHAGDNWVNEHKAADWSGGCVCHSQRGQRKGSMCFLCHDPKTHALLPIRQ
jgi:hypothetical protein